MNENPGSMAQDGHSWPKGIREVHLLEDERVVGLLDGSSGLVEVPTLQGSLLALTDKRVISLIQAEDRRETHVASIKMVQGVSIRAHQRPQKPLIQGVVLILVGILVYLLVGTFSTGIPVNAGITIGALLGGAVALLGLIFIAKYLFWEKGGELIFQTGGLQLTFLYNSEITALAVPQLLRRFFQLQSGQKAEPLYPHAAALGWPPLLRMAPEPAPPAPREAPAAPAMLPIPPTKQTPAQKRRLRRWIYANRASRGLLPRAYLARKRPPRMRRLAILRHRRGGVLRNRRLDSQRLLRLHPPQANGRNGVRSTRRRLAKQAAR